MNDVDDIITSFKEPKEVPFICLLVHLFVSVIYANTTGWISVQNMSLGSS